MKLEIDLPTPADQPGGPQPKGPSRLEDRDAAKRLTYVTDRAFRHEVWTRDRGCCRWCGGRVQKTVEHVPDRGEVHHLHGRLGVLRFEAKAAALFCLECHELLTGKVNERWIVVGTVWWSLPNSAELLIDARAAIHFDRVA